MTTAVCSYIRHFALSPQDNSIAVVTQDHVVCGHDPDVVAYLRRQDGQRFGIVLEGFLLLKEGDTVRVADEVGAADDKTCIAWMGSKDPFLSQRIEQALYEEQEEEGLIWVHANGTPIQPTKLNQGPISLMTHENVIYRFLPHQTTMVGMKGTRYQILKGLPGIPVVMNGVSHGTGWIVSLTVEPPQNESVIVGINQDLCSILVLCVGGDPATATHSHPVRVDVKHRFRHKKILVRAVIDDAIVGIIQRGTVRIRGPKVPVEYYFTSS